MRPILVTTRHVSDIRSQQGCDRNARCARTESSELARFPSAAALRGKKEVSHMGLIGLLVVVILVILLLRLL